MPFSFKREGKNDPLFKFDSFLKSNFCLSSFAFWKQVANILLAHAGKRGGRGLTEAAAEIARAAARSWLAPLLDTACDRLAFVLENLFDLALERNRAYESQSK